MSGFPGTDVRERVIRWLEDGQGELGAILGILHDYERLHGVVQAAERDRERLRAYVHENERLQSQMETLEMEAGKLREEVRELRRLSERYLKEREDIAASLSQLMNDVLMRLRSDQTS